MRAAGNATWGRSLAGLHSRAGGQHQAVWIGQLCRKAGLAGPDAAAGGLCQGARPHPSGGGLGQAGAAVRQTEESCPPSPHRSPASSAARSYCLNQAL